jgi:hypothetical protein
VEELTSSITVFRTSDEVVMVYSQASTREHLFGRDLSLDSTRELFNALADWWHDATDHLSVPTEIVRHPAYLRVIALGDAAVPLILEDLRARGGDWYQALHKITHAQPVPHAHYGRAQLMNEDWFAWARENTYAE